MPDLIVMIIRTLAQTAAGAILTWLATSGYEIDQAQLVGVLFAIFSAAWAAVTTVLARFHPAFGYLSIVANAPTYQRSDDLV